MEGPERQLDQDMLDPDHDAERSHRQPSTTECRSSFTRHYDLWLDPGFTERDCGVRDVEALRCAADAIYPVSTRINHAANDDPECSAPVTAESSSQGQLF